jgi:hypothetical protein
LKAHAWKACLGETLTWVRIPLSPPSLLSMGESAFVNQTRVSATSHSWFTTHRQCSSNCHGECPSKPIPASRKSALRFVQQTEARPIVGHLDIRVSFATSYRNPFTARGFSVQGDAAAAREVKQACARAPINGGSACTARSW